MDAVVSVELTLEEIHGTGVLILPLGVVEPQVHGTFRLVAVKVRSACRNRGDGVFEILCDDPSKVCVANDGTAIVPG
jgi:hypothetical protein